MPTEVTTLRIVVASPSDVGQERRLVESIATELNQGLGAELGVLVTVTRWETRAFPGFHQLGPQGLIDGIIAIPDCDIFVGMFWKRFGTPVYDAESGTAHEFRLAYESWLKSKSPEIMIYFNERKYLPKTVEETNQRRQIIEFKQSFPKEGMWWEYSGPASFQNLFRRHLTERILRASRTRFNSSDEPIRAVVDMLPTSKGFRGRIIEIEQLHHDFENPDVSVVVIEGISGIGKSALLKRFALNLAASSTLCFWQDCRPATTLDSISWELTKFARSLQLERLRSALEAPQISVFERMCGAIREMSDLKIAIFLDDYHLVTDSEVNRLIATIEERGRNIKIFLVSRKVLPVLGKLPPIAVAEEHLRVGLDSEVCREFLRDAGIDLNKEMGHAIWELTGEGHPKALQLFAYRAKKLPVDRLVRSMPVFREDLMRDWLLPLLDDLDANSREALIDLSVFDRPIRFSTLQALYPERDVDALLVSLLERFLLDVVSRDTFLMHPLVREFCYQLLTDKAEKHKWAAEYYVEECGTVADPDAASDSQIDSLIAAWSHFVVADDWKMASEIIDLVRPTLMNRGQYDQVLQLIERTVPADPVDSSFFVIQKARMLSIRGQVESAKEMIRPLLDLENARTSREAVLVMATIVALRRVLAAQRQIGRHKRPFLIRHIRLIAPPIRCIHDSIVSSNPELRLPQSK